MKDLRGDGRKRKCSKYTIMYEILEELTVFLGKQRTEVMSQRLRARDDLSEEPASLPSSTHSSWLTITCISSSQGISALF